MKINNLNDNKITVKAGLANGIIGKARKRGSLSQDNIAKILQAYHHLDANWLFTGESKMLKEKENNMLNESGSQYVALLKGKHSSIKNAIPLIPTEAYAGYGAGEVSITEQDIQDRYIVPEFTNVDFMIRIKGSSMYPKFSSGDVVACKIITDSKFIQGNKVHIFSTREQGVLIKRLKKSENPECFLAVSDNLNYDPFDIPKDEILNLAIVTGVIRLE